MTLASWADCAHNDADDDDMDVKYSVYPRGLERIEVCATIVVFGKRELFAIRLASFIYFLVLRNRTAISIVILFVTSIQLNFSHRKIFIRKCGERDYSSLKLVIIFSRLLFNEEMIDSNRNNILEIYLFRLENRIINVESSPQNRYLYLSTYPIKKYYSSKFITISHDSKPGGIFKREFLRPISLACIPLFPATR